MACSWKKLEEKNWPLHKVYLASLSFPINETQGSKSYKQIGKNSHLLVLCYSKDFGHILAAF